MTQGWICPRCDAVMSPTAPTCFHCKPKEKKQAVACAHGMNDKFCWLCNPVPVALTPNNSDFPKGYP